MNFVSAGEVNVDHEGRTVALSMIFKWYADDFGPPDVVRQSPCQLRSILECSGHWRTVILPAVVSLPVDEVLCSWLVSCTLSESAAQGRSLADSLCCSGPCSCCHGCCASCLTAQRTSSRTCWHTWAPTMSTSRTNRTTGHSTTVATRQRRPEIADLAVPKTVSCH